MLNNSVRLSSGVRRPLFDRMFRTIWSVIGNGKFPKPEKFRDENSSPMVGLRVEASFAGSSGPPMPRSSAQLAFTFSASSRSADLKNE